MKNNEKEDTVICVNGSSYLKWTEKKGFGVFLGTLSGTLNRRTPILDTNCVGTYGGLVCPYEEASNGLYCLTVPGVTALHDFPFRHTQDKAASVPVIDATAWHAGDGGMINTSCCPNVDTYKTLHSFIRKSGHLHDHSTRSKVIYNRVEVVFFKPLRYG